MMGQKITDCFGFMRAQVVANDVNGPLWSLAGWFEKKANDVGRLLFKLRISAGHVAAQSMRLDPGPSPHASHPAVRNAQMSSQLSGAPMSRTIGRGIFSRLQN